MKDNYVKATPILFKLEGFTSEVKGDKGGRTIFGITEKWFPEIVRIMSLAGKERAEQLAIEFYKKEFWDKHKLDDVGYPLDIISFCMIVNSHMQGEQLLKEVITDLHPVGEDWINYLMGFLKFYKQIVRKSCTKCCISKKIDDSKCQRKFEDGWFNRVFTLWEMFK
jgi:hypothetical protein